MLNIKFLPFFQLNICSKFIIQIKIDGDTCLLQILVASNLNCSFDH